jgi:hypothetical protein
MWNRAFTTAVIIGLLVGLGSAPQARAADAPQPRKHGVRVLLIGVDALSLPVLEPLMKAGRLPHLVALKREGGAGPLASYWPTGKLPGQHGIWDHLANSSYNPPEVRTKKRKEVTSADRRSKALWQILGARGIRSLTVGWPVTWPAERASNAVIVAPRVLYGDERRVTIKGSFWRHAPGMVQPARLADRVRALMVEPDQIEKADLAELAALPKAGDPILALPKIADYIYALRWSLARARSVESITLALAAQTKPEVVLAYFQCPDSLGHRFWIFSKPLPDIRARLRQFGIPEKHAEALKAHFGQVINRCHEDVDARVGRLIEALADSDTMIAVISDHGFGDGPKPHPFRAEPYGGIHWSKGAILARAPGLPSGSRIESASMLDITPTILYDLGLPVAADMPGQVLEALFSKARLKKQPVEHIQSYEAKPQTDIPYRQGYPPKPKSFIW